MSVEASPVPLKACSAIHLISLISCRSSAHTPVGCGPAGCKGDSMFMAPLVVGTLFCLFGSEDGSSGPSFKLLNGKASTSSSNC